MDILLDKMGCVELKGLPVDLLTEYYNALATELDRPILTEPATASKLVRRITTLRGVRYAKGLDPDTPANLVVCLAAEPAEGLTIGKRNPQGRAPNFNRYPTKDAPTPPDHGIRAKALELLLTGCVPDDIEMLVIMDGTPEQCVRHTRYRALELIRVLNYRDGWGFYEDADGRIYATDNPEDVDLAADELSVL
jgi:hypothetical protein